MTSLFRQIIYLVLPYIEVGTVHLGENLPLPLGSLDIRRIQKGKPVAVDITDSVRPEQWG